MNILYKYYRPIVFAVFFLCISGVNIFAYGGVSKYFVVPFADQYWQQTGPYPTAFVNIGVFSIVETDKNGFERNQNESIVLTLPAGFEFNTVAKHSVTFVPKKDITRIVIDSVTTSQITITVTTDGNEGELDTIHFNNIEIRAMAAGNSGNLLRVDGKGGTFKIDSSVDNPTNKESLGYLYADANTEGIINDPIKDLDFVEELLMMLEDDDVWGEDPPDSKELPIIRKAIAQIEERIENKKNEIDELESLLDKSETPDEIVHLILEIDSKKKVAASIENNLVSVIENLEEQGANTEEIASNTEISELERQKKEKASELVTLEKELDNSFVPDSIVKLVIVIDEKKKELTILEKRLIRTKAQEIAIIKIVKETEAIETYSSKVAHKESMSPDALEAELISASKEEEKAVIPDKYFVVENILFGFDKSNLERELLPELNKLVKHLKGNPEIKAQIGGHTDHKGPESYNLQLSKKRSQSVADYLIRQGIDPGRLIVKGYGESHPIAPNTFPNGTDNPLGRKLNRRTEIKIYNSFIAI